MKTRNMRLALAVCVAVVAIVVGNTPAWAIIGGTNADQGEFPWMVSVERFAGAWSHSCGGVLVTPTEVLTAAHCVDGFGPDQFRIKAGVANRCDPGAQTINAADIEIHPDYLLGLGTFPNDIAIIHLEAPVDISDSDLAQFPEDNSEQFVGMTCTIVGWGRTGPSNLLPCALKKASIPVISTAEANDRMPVGIGAWVTDDHIAVYDGIRGTCNGDQGGPVVCALNGYAVVAGIASWMLSGGGECMPYFPSVSTRTSTHLDWIH